MEESRLAEVDREVRGTDWNPHPAETLRSSLLSLPRECPFWGLVVWDAAPALSGELIAGGVPAASTEWAVIRGQQGWYRGKPLPSLEGWDFLFYRA
jgi:hypothetical protein